MSVSRRLSPEACPTCVPDVMWKHIAAPMKKDTQAAWESGRALVFDLSQCQNKVHYNMH